MEINNGEDSTFVVASLSFKAMAPIVLVHGFNSGPWAFGPNPPDSAVCKSDNNSSDGGQNLVQALQNAKAPFDCTIKVLKQDSSDDGAQGLLAQMPGVLAEFGANHAHIISHSKGGLWSREFVQLISTLDPSQQIGIYSLATLDTPHHGSVLADTVVAIAGLRHALCGRAGVLEINPSPVQCRGV